MSAYPASVYNDFQGLAALKHQARQDQAGSLDKVAKQFESLFVQMMVKQMRQASFGGGLLDSDKTRFYQDMYDKQLSLHLSESGGIGIGEMLSKQLAKEQQSEQPGMIQGTAIAPSADLADYRNNPVSPAIRYLSVKLRESVNAPESSEIKPSSPVQSLDSPEKFVKSLWSAAEQAASTIGLPTEALLAQAALETGWGNHVMSAGNGKSSHNLFGIKADQRWDGDQVRRDTLEYENGVAIRKRDAFRAYRSYDESFQDYVAFLQSSPRYAEALAKGHDSQAYFSALQDAGYATDPKYAEKILRVMDGTEMRAALQELKSEKVRPI
ncbi:MAG: flagellar assembly peptidoglycan hydrolase FlgJ [Pseudomonadota bacterium]